MGDRAVSIQHVGTYLNDHLMGATAAVELLEGLESAHADTDLSSTLAGLRADILADKAELEALIDRLECARSPLRRAAG